MKIIAIAPHPDDETLGCGGTLLKHRDASDDIYLVLVTTAGSEYSEEHINNKYKEIDNANEIFEFKTIFDLGFPVTHIGSIDISEIIGKLMDTFKLVGPDIIYVPFPYDIHTDHQVVFDAVSSCTKWFRIPTLKRILAYETISETDFIIRPGPSFIPNVFVNIEDHIDKKIEAMKCYASEIAMPPFPRSEENIRALATLRGSTSGFKAAEAFMLLKEIDE